MNSATGTKKTVGFGKALVVFICVFVLILCGINVLGTSAHIPLVIATIVATIAGVSSGFTWDEMEKGMSETIKASCGETGYLRNAGYRDTGFAPLTDVRVTSVEKITRKEPTDGD